MRQEQVFIEGCKRLPFIAFVWAMQFSEKKCEQYALKLDRCCEEIYIHNGCRGNLQEHLTFADVADIPPEASFLVFPLTIFHILQDDRRERHCIQFVGKQSGRMDRGLSAQAKRKYNNFLCCKNLLGAHRNVIYSFARSNGNFSGDYFCVCMPKPPILVA